MGPPRRPKVITSSRCARRAKPTNKEEKKQTGAYGTPKPGTINTHYAK